MMAAKNECALNQLMVNLLIRRKMRCIVNFLTVALFLSVPSAFFFPLGASSCTFIREVLLFAFGQIDRVGYGG